MTSPFAPTPAYPIQSHIYSLGNQSVPIMHQVPSSGPQQTPPFLHRQPSLATLQHSSGHAAAADSQFSSPGLYQSSLRDTSTVMPSRYRSAQSLRPHQYSERAFHPAQHMAHLRSSSYTGHSPYAWSEASLTPSDSATEKYRFLHDGSVSDETTEHSLRRRPSFYTAESHLSRSSTPQSFVTALPYPSVSTTSRLGTATPSARGQDRLVRPMNNYKVDSIVNHTPSRQEPVGPLLRFQNPRTGEPRLTIYETIERKENLGKQPLENQRRSELQQRGEQLKTVYETIEEKELLDGKPQRGLDTCIKKGWGKYY